MTDDATSATQATMAVDGGVGVGAVVAGRYHIRGILGAGGMGAVFRAHDRELDEEVALKIIKREVATDRDAIVRFRLEVKLARRIAHPNVARVFDLGEADGTRYLTMELVAGTSLRHAPPQPLPEILRIAAEIAAGLAAVHAGGVIHRDLKPDNILLAAERVVLTDFGIARAEQQGDSLQTSGNVVGTPAYIAPEQLEGGSVDGRADVYALGVLLYELVAKRLPFDGDTPTAIACARLVHPPIPLRDRAPDAPEGVAALVMDMLARRTADRPDAHTVVTRLARLRGLGGTGEVLQLTGALAIAMPTLEQTVHFAPPDTDAATAALGADLVRALGDSLVKERVRVVREAGADLAVELALRAAGDRVRARLRLVGRDGTTAWADRVDAALADPFALEDAVVAALVPALRSRTGAARGPDGPIRERYDRAHAMVDTSTLAAKQEGVRLLEELEREAPGDPWVSGLIARTLITIALQSGAQDESIFARAEELALRAIDRDPSNGQGYAAIASVRSVRGEHAGALAAAREALRRTPLLGDAHYQIGRMLCWAGRVAEGLQRLELALRIDGPTSPAGFEKIGALALIGDRAGAERELARIEAQQPSGGILARLRLFVWWQDREVARETAAIMARSDQQASWQKARPIIEAFANGEADARLDYGRAALAAQTKMRVAPRHRAMMLEITIELLMLMSSTDEAVGKVEELVALPHFIDLLWLDRCPSLDPLRSIPEFAHMRAIVAGRIAQLLA